MSTDETGIEDRSAVEETLDILPALKYEDSSVGGSGLATFTRGSEGIFRY